MNKDWLKRIVKYEGDRREFLFWGRRCVILRVKPSGQLCGYAEIPKELLNKSDRWFVDQIEVHGGVTFVGNRFGSEGDQNKFIGFDCAHWDDICPGFADYDMPVIWEGTYKSMDFCEIECKAMASQLRILAAKENLK